MKKSFGSLLSTLLLLGCSHNSSQPDLHSSYSCAVPAGTYEMRLTDSGTARLVNTGEQRHPEGGEREIALNEFCDEHATWVPVDHEGHDCWGTWQLKEMADEEPLRTSLQQWREGKDKGFAPVLLRLHLEKTSPARTGDSSGTSEKAAEHAHEPGAAQDGQPQNAAPNTLRFGAYIQSRDHPKGSWCVVSVPVEVEGDDSADVEFTVSQSATASPAAKPAGTPQRHH